MSTPLRVLFVEDSEDDMLLQMRELRQAGYDLVHERVETAAALEQSLARQEWEIVLSDYTLPRFTGLEALRLVKATHRDLPFVLISGTVGEDVAVECMKAGAADYLLKDRLARLAPAVRRELRDAAERRRRRQAERALRESQSLFTLICEHTSEMLALFRADAAGVYRLASVNRAWLGFAARVGRPAGEKDCLGQSPEGVLARLGAPAEVVEVLRRHFAEPTGSPFELEWPAPGGVVFTEQQPIAFREEGGRMLLWASRDVSARKRAEAEQRRLEARLMHAQQLEALGTMAAGIAHDFNNLLAGLSGHTELIRAEIGGVEGTRESLTQLMAGIQRAGELVRRILDFSRKRTSLRKPIPLGPVVHEALKFLRPMVPAGVTLQAHLPSAEPLVLADAGQVHQVVANLCSNALQALPAAGGVLQVSLDTAEVDAAFADAHYPLRPGPHVRLRVRDTGCGMEEATLTRLFEPFFTTRPAGQGTGLGLAVVQSIVRAHHGAITVASRPGRGTTFELYFPVAEADTGPGPRSGEWTPLGRGERVLFVDDEEYITRMAATLLKRLGFEVSAFTEPQKALDAFLAEPAVYAALLTDLMMPGLKGTELARRVRAVRADLPVVLTTGFCDPRELERARELGFVLVLEKPFSLEKFAQTLRQVLRSGGT